MIQRLRRLRKTPLLREMVAETHLSKDMFIYPYFITKGKNVINPVEAMPGINRFSPDTFDDAGLARAVFGASAFD